MARIVSAALAANLVLPGWALAACPQELAVYEEPEAKAGLEFTPADPGAATSHSFKLKFPENSVILDGLGMMTEDPTRNHGMLMKDCPVGDVTGEELEACTIWQGTVYAVDADGKAGPLPAQGQPAARQIILTDLAAHVRQSSVWGIGGLSKLPYDVFIMSGCQE